jgi:hypothetical protein
MSTNQELLKIDQIQDRGLVFLDNVLQGTLGWSEPGSPTSVMINTRNPKNSVLQILVRKTRKVKETNKFKEINK